MTMTAQNFGPMLRHWRGRRRLSQLALAGEAGLSQRHLSFIEGGRAAPSRDMVLRLAETLRLPLRARNTLLTAAGFAAVYPERALEAPDMTAALAAVETVLRAHEPFPALAVDRRWHLLRANAAVPPLLAGASPALLAPPVNVLRLSLHPEGLAPRIRNYRQWRAHVTARLAAQAEADGDPALAALLDELRGYPVPPGARPWRAEARAPLAGIALPFEFDTGAGILSLISTTTVFGTATDVTLAEVTIETFLPLDAATEQALRRTARA